MPFLYRYNEEHSSMIEDTAVITTSASGVLALAVAPDVKPAQLESFKKAVAANAEDICRGLVGQLEEDDVKATVLLKDGRWEVVVGNAKSAPARRADGETTTNITITANAADMPAVITSLGDFFSNWRVVAGLIALGGSYVAGQYVLTVLARR
jgi:hypothetical protein